ncbi:MAG: ABC transporter ATP-binding protein [Hirschia sp.]|nr:ABC transporter ATP-binding protein [Hirschia sp.]MBF19163.1 ABC transporter ATP-binding protein [Hirschia sp.]
MTDRKDPERNRFSARAGRMASVGANLAGAALSFGANSMFGSAEGDERIARALKEALGRSKGPLMKVAQMLSTIPDFLPEEYASELAGLQAHAPSMGWAFVQRRMRAELGDDWGGRFTAFGREAAHAASLGQVHKAKLHDGRFVACKLQYPDMASAVEADLSQLHALMGLFKRVDGAIDPDDMFEEIADRLREELEYEREAKLMALYANILSDSPNVVTPEPIRELSTQRLLTMTWLDGQGLSSFQDAPQEVRNRIARLLFEAWWGPLTSHAVIHGDPHLGNYSLTPEAEQLNLIDFGCVRIFPPSFIAGVVALKHALERDDFEGTREAYRIWGFENLTNDLVETLNIWARFIYGPLMDDRVRTVADGVAPGAYGRKEAFAVRKRLKEVGGVKVPREFVFMDRAAIGLGAAYLRLGAEINFYEMFETRIEGFDEVAVGQRQSEALQKVGL